MALTLNKKSLIQVVVLAGLLIAAGSAYFMQQQGGLDFITSLFGENPTPASRNVEKTLPVRPRARFAERAPTVGARARSRTGDPVIPALPVKGELNGKLFSVDQAFVERGALVLLAGKDSANLGVSVELPAKPWEVPAGKSFKFTNTSPDAPRIRVSWSGDDGSPANPQEYTGEYTLVLDLGPEANRKVPGKIYLSLPPGDKSNTIAGTFEADIRGFRIVDGKPDLTSDSTDTLQYLALRDLLKDDPDKNVSDIVFRDQRLDDAASAKEKTGYLEMDYRVGDAAPLTRRLQFIKDKEKGEWRVLRGLPLNEIDEAHPYVAPRASDSASVLFPYLAARHLEAQLHRKAPKRSIFDVTFATRADDKHKIGQCEVSYRLEGAKQPSRVVYLLRRKPAGWAIEGELGKKQHINFNTGRVEKR